MGNENKGNGDSVSRGVAVLGAGLALAVGFFLGFTVHGMLGGKSAPTPTVASAPASGTAASSAVPGPAPESPMGKRIQSVVKQTQLEPNNPAAWTELGNLYYDTKQPQKAIAAYEKSLTLRPGDPNVLTDLGVMYRQVGQFDKALACFDKAIAVDPDHIIAHFNKSVVLESDKHDTTGALAALRALAARKPDAVLPGGRSIAQAIKDLSAK